LTPSFFDIKPIFKHHINMNQFLIFALIGVCNTALDFGLWEIFVRLLNGKSLKIGSKQIANSYSLAHVFSSLIAFNFSFFMNKTFTFQSNIGYWEGFPKFAIFSIISMLVAAAILNFLTSTSHLEKLLPKHSAVQQNYPKICKVATILIVMFVNYFGFKFVIFATK
jgi:putative flippase GtrA